MCYAPLARTAYAAAPARLTRMDASSGLLTLEAAHRLPTTPPRAQSARLHGHLVPRGCVRGETWRRQRLGDGFHADLKTAFRPL